MTTVALSIEILSTVIARNEAIQKNIEEKHNVRQFQELDCFVPRNDENQRSCTLRAAHSHPLKLLNHALNQIQPHLPKGWVGCV
jgi:hypothetical protein